MPRDEEFCAYLDRSGVEWRRLDEPSAVEAERDWREVYGRAFMNRPRLKQGAKAEHEYQQIECACYLVVPFTSNVAGLPIQVRSRSLEAYECRGPLIPLGAFHNVELFICPADFAWTMVHTHEDHAFGGPFFIREEWRP